MPETAPGFIGLTHLYQKKITEVDWAIVRDAVTSSTQALAQAVDELLSMLVTDITSPQTRFYQPATGTLQPVDEYGRPKPASNKFYYDVAFPMHMAAHAWGASWIAREKMSVEDANDETLTASRSDADWIIRHVMAALFYNNTWNYDDPEKGTLAIQSLARGEAAVRYPLKDGSSIASHNHFFAQANAIDNSNNPFPTVKREITHHPGQQGSVVVYCHNDQRASIEALAAFREIKDVDLVPGTSSDRVDNGAVPDTLADEIFGKVNGVWVGEWSRMPSGYLMGHVPGVPVVGRRQDPESSLKGLITKEITGGVFPTFEFYRRSGFGILNRVAAVIYRIGNASYAPPSDYATLPLAV
jgi:hypothetical protein